MLNAIIARTKNNIIGDGFSLPWREVEGISWDLKNFKEFTSGKTVYMGFNTYKSFERTLPNRKNVVETRAFLENHKSEKIKEGFFESHNLNEYMEENPNEEIVLIGGAKLLKKYALKIDSLILTTFNFECSGDVKFPEEILENFTKKTVLKNFDNGKIELFQ